MVLPLIFGVVILIIAAYIALKVLGNIVWGAALIALVFIASFLILGSSPDLSSIPIIGPYLPKLPSTTGGFIEIINNILYSAKVVSVAKDDSGNLLVAVANTGKLQLTGLKIFIDSEEAVPLNAPKTALNSGEVTIVQLDWNKPFVLLTVKTNEATASYSPI